MEKLTNIELSDIKVHTPVTRFDKGDAATSTAGFKEDDIDTPLGPIHVTVQGDRSRAAILTYHDIGLTSNSCFQGFFNHIDMQPVLKYFCVYHVSAPGQQEGSVPLTQGYILPSGLRHSESEQLLSSNGEHGELKDKKRSSLGNLGDPKFAESYVYPTMDQLAEMLLPVMQYYGLKRTIGFGVGAGANVLARFALLYPDRVDALALINCSSTKAGWMEWAYQKLNVWHLKNGQLSTSVEEFLLWHWFGQKTMLTNQDLVNMYSKVLETLNPQNLGYFIESYIKRSDLGIVRELDPSKKDTVRMIRCPVMLVSGEYSPHLNDTVNMNGRLDPTTSSWMKFECGGMVLEEAPDKLAESFRLFLQGMGYIPALSQIKLVESRSGHPSQASMLTRGSVSDRPVPVPSMSATQEVC
ncbi:Protein NDRG3 [Lamellibrachia satsuma]|nr:Protein NDRG3 [Lamellibrachia satsuma]